MIKKEFKSDITKDYIDITYFAKSHKSNFYIKQFDDFSEHIKLVGTIIEYLKENDIKWVCLKIDGEPEIPPNTVWFKHKKTGNTCCHIEDFEKFYLKNMNKLIKLNSIYINPNPKTDDGWNVIVNKKNLKKNKLNTIRDQIKSLTINWTAF